MSRAVNLQRTFDDLALMQQGVVLEPLLQAISDFLDDHEGLITAIQGASEAYASCQRPAA